MQWPSEKHSATAARAAHLSTSMTMTPRLGGAVDLKMSSYQLWRDSILQQGDSLALHFPINVVLISYIYLHLQSSFQLGANWVLTNDVRDGRGRNEN